MKISASIAAVKGTYFARTGYAQAYKSGLNATVQINDQKLRDGFEKVFALVPSAAGAWKRVDLEYKKPAQPWLRAEDHTWNLSLDPAGVDVDAVSRLGVAFGIEMNGQTIWAQTPDDNWGAEVYNR
jgi:hypothetical protein